MANPQALAEFRAAVRCSEAAGDELYGCLAAWNTLMFLVQFGDGAPGGDFYSQREADALLEKVKVCAILLLFVRF